MTLKQLEAFYWAATCSSFAIAAGRLNITVSSLSKRIAELEMSLGTELFNRTARSATLTTVGEQMIPHAKDLLGNADQFLRYANSQMSLSGRCRFGVGELTSLTWMPDLIAQIQAYHPDLLIEPIVGVGQDLERGLEDGELDFAIIAGPSTRISIASHIIGKAEFTWVASNDFSEQPASLEATDLPDITLITLPQGAGTVRLIDHWLSNLRTSPARILSCQNWGGVAGLIRRGLGVGFLPEAWAESLIARGQMVHLDKFARLSPLQYTFQWRRDDSRPMIQSIREIASDTIDFHSPTCLI
ncbi:HTH-type transcriptional regulator GltR [Pseudomonas sp. AD21]|uniref:LysR family transcriptional regulator n=1 Tax=Pseudomonas sp. AD21 TaxID=396378 RepID=UPI000C855401|nr:LysR family transcriptional regulator [Pseudomonas sp. AD21]PMQ11604.1 HTH-type transcriptional regulator GltR [Pseudomonas sp. AD21]